MTSNVPAQRRIEEFPLKSVDLTAKLLAAGMFVLTKRLGLGFLWEQGEAAFASFAHQTGERQCSSVVEQRFRKP